MKTKDLEAKPKDMQFADILRMQVSWSTQQDSVMCLTQDLLMWLRVGRSLKSIDHYEIPKTRKRKEILDSLVHQYYELYSDIIPEHMRPTEHSVCMSILSSAKELLTLNPEPSKFQIFWGKYIIRNNKKTQKKDTMQ